METFKCYVCKVEVEGGYHVFMEARSAREKDRFRDVCEKCVPGATEFDRCLSPETIKQMHGEYASGMGPREIELREMFREAMKILPDRVRHGIYEAYWEKCERVLG